MSFKRLTPDPAKHIMEASRAAEQIARMSNELMPLIHAIEDNLICCEQMGLKAEKLDYCTRRINEISHALNSLELGSFCGIAVKNTCQELWQKLP